MDPKPSTIDLLVQNASLYLHPLFATVEQDGIQAFLEKELDIDIASGSFHGGAIGNEVNQCKTAITSLFATVGELKTALDEKDYATIGIKSADAYPKLKRSLSRWGRFEKVHVLFQLLSLHPFRRNWRTIVKV